MVMSELLLSPVLLKELAPHSTSFTLSSHPCNHLLWVPGGYGQGSVRGRVLPPSPSHTPSSPLGSSIPTY